MKKIIVTSTVELGSGQLRINANAQKGHGCFYEILAKTHENMNALLSYHCKIFVIQFSFNPYDFTPTNQPISKIMATLKKRLRRKYNLARLASGWVRETGESGVQHYHVVLMLDGNKVNRQGSVMALVKEVLESRGYPAPHFSTPHTVKRGQTEDFSKAFYHLSYLAKVNTKGSKPKATNDYSFSRLLCKI
jgi:hypothetical protein